MSTGTPQPVRPLGRRRPVIAGLLATAVVVAVILLLVLVGGGGQHPRFVPPGPKATVVGSSSRLQVSIGPTFQPSASATRAAARMPLPVQVAQLFLVTVDGNTPVAARGLSGTSWGGIVLDSSNYSSLPRLPPLIRALRTQLRTPGAGQPLIAATQEGGSQTAFSDLPPESQAALGAARNPSRAQAQALAAGRALRHLGVPMTLSPLADVNIPSGALTGRLFSSSPQLVTLLTSAMLTGYAQADEISAVGHFPGAGAASADPDQGTANVGGSLSQLESRDLVPFAAVASRAPVILMSNASYAAFDGVTPASLSASAVSLLRDKLRYQGVVMSDDLDATLQPTGLSAGAAAVQALQAGDDLIYISGPGGERQAAYNAVLSAAQHGSKVQAQVREALLRVLSLKARYGLLR